MTYTFKLSRRLALVKAATLVAVVQLTMSCNADDSLNSNPSEGDSPTSLVIMPDSTILEVKGTVDFSTAAGANSTLLKGKRWGQNRKVIDLEISPGSSNVVPGDSRIFNATATLSDGSTVEPALAWSATGGSIDKFGKYTAGKVAGSYEVTGTASNGMTDTAMVTVSAVAQLVLSPASISLPAGGSQQFEVVFQSPDGSSLSGTPTFAATGGTISSTGLYTAGVTAGTYRVIVTHDSSLADTAQVVISATEPPTLSALTLTPASISLSAGANQQFTAQAVWSDGGTRPLTISWSATGGTISSAGLYTAGSTAGTFRVIGSASDKADTSVVNITVPVSAPTPPPPVSGKTFFSADAESGAVIPPWSWDATCCGAGQPVTNSMDRAKTGNRSFKFQMDNPTLIASPEGKVQVLVGKPQTSMGTVGGGFGAGYYSWWAYIDAGYSTNNVWNMMLGWMTGAPGAPSPIAFMGVMVVKGVPQVTFTLQAANNGSGAATPDIPNYDRSGGWYFQTATSPNGVTPVPKGRWVHFVAHTNFQPTNGRVKIWQDGVLVMDVTHPLMDVFNGGGGGSTVSGNPSKDMVLQFGMYGGTKTDGVQRMYADDFKVTDYLVTP